MNHRPKPACDGRANHNFPRFPPCGRWRFAAHAACRRAEPRDCVSDVQARRYTLRVGRDLSGLALCVFLFVFSAPRGTFVGKRRPAAVTGSTSCTHACARCICTHARARLSSHSHTKDRRVLIAVVLYRDRIGRGAQSNNSIRCPVASNYPQSRFCKGFTMILM